MQRLGIISGGGELPHIAYETAKKIGMEPVYLPILESDFYLPEKDRPQIPIRITKIGEVLKTCKREKFENLFLAGKVEKSLLYKTFSLDLKAISLLAKMKTKGDYSIFHTVATEFEKSGIQFLSQKVLLEPLLLKAGRYTKKKISSIDIADIEYGMDIARSIADMDVGQSVVVYDGNTIAIEAVEGTDAMVKRAGNILNSKKQKGGVLCKSSRRSQDPRFDLPAVGIRTIESMKEAGLTCLAIREGETLVIDPVRTISLAEKLGIDFISWGRRENLGSQKKITGN